MSNTPNEQNNGGQDETKTHPAYQAILDVLPDSLHAVVIPTLKEWDANVTRRFQEIHSSYEDLKPYKKLAENGIEADYAEQSIILADQLQRDPRSVIEHINTSFNVGLNLNGQAPSEQPASTSEDELDDLDFDNLDTNELLKNPQFKAMYDTVQKMQNDLESQRKAEEEDKEIAEFEEYLDELERTTTEAGQPFNRLFVTALMNSGLKGEEAVEQYHQVLAGNTQVPNTEQETTTTTSTDDDPPVVMGGAGTGGSGTPDGSVNFGTMPKDDVNKTVEQIIAQALQDGSSNT